MKYVVRSMSTTDYDIVRGIRPEPFHIYLMPPEKRGRAYWSGMWDAMVFDTPQEAEAEIIFAGLKEWDLKTPSHSHQVVPVNATEVPDYWEIQKMNSDRKRALREAAKTGVVS